MNEPAATPNKRALLVGVNKYPNLPPHSQLRGCENDVAAVRHMLVTTFKFPPENVRVLVNEEATEQAVRGALEQLLGDCGEGDIVVFHFSGHGSQMAPKGEKPRGYDESIMPHDSGRMRDDFPRKVAPRDIRDTEINEWLSRLTRKTPYITLLFDSCHSGSITRLADGEEAGRLRWVPPDPLPAGAQPAAPGGTRGASRDVGGSGWLPESDKYVLLAACAAEQGAYELDHTGGDGGTQRFGAFTFHLTREIEQGFQNSDGRLTYRDIWERVAAGVNERFRKQTPQLEGARDRVVFNVEDVAPMRYLLVAGRRGDEVDLAGGAIHGLTVGSRWDIYPAGTKRTADAKEQRQGVVEVTSVGPFTAKAKVLEESPAQAVAANSRAVEDVHADPETRLPVGLRPAPAGHGPLVAELRRTLERSRLLKLTEASGGAQVEIGVRPGGGGARGVWEVTDGSAPLLPPYPADAPESLRSIKENLETIWRFRKVLSLRNEKSELKGKIEFALLKKDAGGVWREVPAGEQPVFREGEPIAFRVVNRSDSLVHVSVLDLGLSKRVAVLYPPAGASEPVAAKRSGESEQTDAGGNLVVGAGGEIELFFPDKLDFLPATQEGAPAEGVEHFKLVATTARHDLSFLNQPGLREGPLRGSAHPLEKMLYLATAAEPLREARVTLDPREEWYTCERSFRLRRDV